MTQTLAAALTSATARLAQAGVPDPARDARRLLAHATGIDPARLTLHLRAPVEPQAAARFAAALAERAARRPVSQITGSRIFWGRSFEVTPDVLDPRPETETLVATALEQPFARLLDLGTGSGALAVSLLAERPVAVGHATDISPAALRVARRNAAAHGVADRLTLVETDWAKGLAGPFDLIVSNPPYIPLAEMPGLAAEVRDYEPALALTDGGDGLGAYRALAAQIPAILAPGGRVAVEIGPGQADAVGTLFAQAGLETVQCRNDLDGRARGVVATAPRVQSAPGR